MDTAKTFEAVLRDAGVGRLRLDQVVKLYHRTFPADAMRADMRQRLHDVLMNMIDTGVVSVPEDGAALENDPLGLPQAVEIAEPFPVPSTIN